MKKNIIIVAGGTGSRMNAALPKQFLCIAGEPVLYHTLRAFQNFENGIRIIIAMHADYKTLWEDLCTKHSITIPHELVSGGETRFDSVKNALAIADDNCMIGIHDAVRPFVDKETIFQAFKIAEQYGAAIPVIVPTDSLRRLGNEESHSVDRRDFRIVQTPQCFRSELIKKAYLNPRRDQYTDDASVASDAGMRIMLTPGNARNIKITEPLDLLFAESILKENIQR
ncbi:MAG: 2-C-methyl-D-erythritol 4-phosphate cytidylyltransferase [Bacteroidota bacterium]